MRFAARLSYPEEGQFDWGARVREFEPVGWVEVAFANPGLFEGIPLEAVVEPFKSVQIHVVAVHMAYARVADRERFERTLRRTIELADLFGADHIVAHPNRGRLSEVLPFLDDVVRPVLLSWGKTLCWEAFDSGRRIFRNLEDVVRFSRERPAFRVCYDFSHHSGTQPEVESEIVKNLEWIEHFHLSNRVRAGRVRHLPVFWNEEAGEFGRDLELGAILRTLAREGYMGTLTLEYQSQFRAHLIADALRLSREFSG